MRSIISLLILTTSLVVDANPLVSFIIAKQNDANEYDGPTRLIIPARSTSARQFTNIEHSLNERLKNLKLNNNIADKSYESRVIYNNGDESDSATGGRNLYLYPLNQQAGQTAAASGYYNQQQVASYPAVASQQPVYQKPAYPMAQTQSVAPQQQYQQYQQQQQQQQSYRPMYGYRKKKTGRYNQGGYKYNYQPQAQYQAQSGPYGYQGSSQDYSASSAYYPNYRYGWQSPQSKGNGYDSPANKYMSRPNYKKIGTYEKPIAEEEIQFEVEEELVPTTSAPAKATIIDVDLDKDIDVTGDSKKKADLLRKKVDHKLDKDLEASIKKKLGRKSGKKPTLADETLLKAIEADEVESRRPEVVVEEPVRVTKVAEHNKQREGKQSDQVKDEDSGSSERSSEEEGEKGRAGESADTSFGPMPEIEISRGSGQKGKKAEEPAAREAEAEDANESRSSASSPAEDKEEDSEEKPTSSRSSGGENNDDSDSLEQADEREMSQIESPSSERGTKDEEKGADDQASEEETDEKKETSSRSNGDSKTNSRSARNSDEQEEEGDDLTKEEPTERQRLMEQKRIARG